MALIERKAKVFSVNNNEYLPPSFIENFDNKTVSYTTGFGETGLSVGIPVSEQAKCPQFVKSVGVDPNNPNWTEKVSDYWAEFEYKIPLGKIGKNNKVEDGLEVDGSYTKGEDGVIHPNDINGYILLNLMENDIEVAKSVGDWPYKNQYKFFCLDTTKQKEEENKAIKELCLDKGYILRVSHKCKKICLDEGVTAHKLYTKSGKLKLKAVLAFPSNIINRALNI